MIDKKWNSIINLLDFAFQPIVNIKSGRVFGIEALLRNYKEAGNFNSIYSLFDEAYHDGVLYQLDLKLRAKAIEKFQTIETENAKLFYNIDNRLIYMPDFTLGNTDEILEKLNLPKSALCLEITEKATIHDPSSVQNLVNRYKKEGFDVAIDNFGTGVAGLQILYYAQNDFIKLDRFFINDIHSDAKKRLFCSNIINMAHLMGLKVIANGVEEQEEYLTCKDIGVDFIQGFLVQKPKLDPTKIRLKYPAVSELYKNDQRNYTSNIIDKSKIDFIEPLSINTSLHDLFIYFQTHPENIFVPIIDDLEQLQGVIYEKDIKQISYSQYGISLAKNDQSNSNSKLKQFIKSTISSEITWGVDKVLQVYNTDRESSFGIFITKNGKYHGFIDVNNLLSISYNRNLEIAKDQNPLTKLPGNRQIDIFISEALTNKDQMVHHIVYFDFNDFKPFNDAYGFRQGDRAIMIFADILKTSLANDTFIAHIGGDDFFMGFRGKPYDLVYTVTDTIQQKFRNEVLNLYNDTDKTNGYIETADRFGIKRKFNLLGVCSAIIELSTKRKTTELDLVLGKLKKEAKKSPTPLGSSICHLS
jgi:diguanylate cyclase (GGDEF)-like protein